MSKPLHDKIIELVLAARTKIRKTIPGLIDGRRPRTMAVLRSLSSAAGVRVVENESLPGNLLGIAMNVEGFPFVVLDERTKGLPEQAFVLAHELAHVALGHLDVPNFAASSHAYTGSPDELAVIRDYSDSQEQEADLLGLEILIPELYLHDCVERNAWIPTRKEAKAFGQPTRLFAARVEAYRLMNGFDRTLEISRRRHEELSRNGWSIGNVRWENDRTQQGKELEMVNDGALELFLAAAGVYAYRRSFA